MKKVGFLFCVLLLIVPLENLTAKERHGADAVIVKNDGQAVKGELVAVKEHSLLLLDSSTKSDLSIEISEINSIRIAKKSNALAGTIIGSLLGGGAGVLIGSIVGKPKGSIVLVDYRTAFTIGGAAVGVLVGGAGGYLVGSHKKEWETFDIEGKSPEEIKVALERLSSRARVPDFR